MPTFARKWWIGGIIVLVIIALITWAGTREEAQQPVTGTSVVVQSPPASARAGAPTSLTWEVRASAGAVTTHTAVHWDSTSHPGAFGKDAGPTTAGYPSIIPDYASGSFALPRTFTGAVVFPTAGTSFYRAHALIDGLHYWSPEYTTRVE